MCHKIDGTRYRTEVTKRTRDCYSRIGPFLLRLGKVRVKVFTEYAIDQSQQKPNSAQRTGILVRGPQERLGRIRDVSVLIFPGTGTTE